MLRERIITIDQEKSKTSHQERSKTTDSDPDVFQCVGNGMQVYFIFLSWVSSRFPHIPLRCGLFRNARQCQIQQAFFGTLRSVAHIQCETFTFEHTDLSENFLQLSSVTSTYFEGDPEGKVSQIQ